MLSTSYQPSSKILDKYAEVLVNFALNSGDGVKKGEIVQVAVPDVAKPLALALQNVLLKAGAHPLMRLLPTGFDHDFFTFANDEQLQFFPRDMMMSRAQTLDHSIGIIADVDPYELSEVPPQKILTRLMVQKPYRDWLTEKENKGKFTWTVALWGTEAKAKEVGLTLEEYWQQIIQACFLDAPDPINQWREVSALNTAIKDKLNQLEIAKLQVQGEDADLIVTLGKDRLWQGGGGRNIPSFEIFTSPDWRGVEGWIRFNQPLYRYGNVIQDVFLRLEHGLIVEAKAKKGNEFLQQMLQTPNANKIGEFSLTDHRMSRITHTMAETLFDENMGGRYGNTHLAVGMAYKNCYRGNPDEPSEEDWQAMGFNDSAEHTDIVSTTDRQVTAILTSGEEKLIYRKGEFVL